MYYHGLRALESQGIKSIRHMAPRPNYLYLSKYICTQVSMKVPRRDGRGSLGEICRNLNLCSNATGAAGTTEWPIGP